MGKFVQIIENVDDELRHTIDDTRKKNTCLEECPIYFSTTTESYLNLYLHSEHMNAVEMKFPIIWRLLLDD